MRELQAGGFRNLIVRTHAELDLEDATKVRRLFESEKPEYVFDAAARVGGILANSERPADFIHDNIWPSRATSLTSPGVSA